MRVFSVFDLVGLCFWSFNEVSFLIADEIVFLGGRIPDYVVAEFAIVAILAGVIVALSIKFALWFFYMHNINCT